MRPRFRFSIGSLLLVGALTLAGCKKEQAPAAGDNKGTGTGVEALDKLAKQVQDKVGEATKLAGDERKGLDPEQYEKLILALSACELKETGVDFKCEAYNTYREARSRNTRLKDLAGMSSRLGLKHLTDKSPTVRYVAAGLLKSLFGSGAAAQEAVLKAAPEEKNPIVLARMISAVASSAKRNPKVAEWVVKMADHTEPVVRREALNWLASSWYMDVAGAHDKLMEKIEKDPDQKVRQTACHYAGKTGNEKLLPLYKKLTAKPDKDPEMYTACMRGLMEMWNPFLTRKIPASQKAYTLTMARMNDKPRGKDRPPWIMMNDFGRVPRDNPPWYNEKAVKKMLVSVALDDKARWLARTGAVRSLARLKAKPELEQIKKALGTKTEFDNKQVLRTVDQELAKL